MPGLCIGSALSAPLIPADVEITPPPVASFSAQIMPAESPLYEGQGIQDMTGFATMTSAANFSSTGGAIAQVSVTALGDASDVTAPLAEAQSAGYSVTVTDTAGNTAVFATRLVGVEYKVRILTQPDGTLEIDINPRVPATDLVEITVTEPADFAGTYPLTPADLATGPVNLDPPEVLGSVGAGNVLTARRGLWVSAADGSSPVLGLQWLRNGTAIPGATAAEYTQVADDAGAELRVAVTGTDPLGSRTVSSAPLPGTEVQTAFATRLAGRGILDAGTRSSEVRTLAGVELGQDATKEVYLLVGTNSGATGDLLGHASVSVAGVAATRIASNGDSADIDRVHTELWHATVPATAGDIVLTPVNQYRQLTVQVVEVVGGVLAEARALYGTEAATDLSATLAPGDVFLGAVTRFGAAGETTDFTGATETDVPLESTFAGKYSTYCRHDATAQETPRVITATHSGTAVPVAALSIVLRAA